MLGHDSDGFYLLRRQLLHGLRHACQSACRMRLGERLQHRYSLQSALEIATATVYKVKQVTLQ